MKEWIHFYILIYKVINLSTQPDILKHINTFEGAHMEWQSFTAQQKHATFLATDLIFSHLFGQLLSQSLEC